MGTLDLNAFASTNPAFAAYTRLGKAATAIVTNLGAPDIMSLQEVSDLATLTALSSAVNTLGSTSYNPYLVPGAGSSNVGFLVKSSTLTTDSVGLAPNALTATYTTSSGGSAALWDAPPLVLKAEFVRIGKNYPVTVIDPSHPHATTPATPPWARISASAAPRRPPSCRSSCRRTRPPARTLSLRAT